MNKPSHAAHTPVCFPPPLQSHPACAPKCLLSNFYISASLVADTAALIAAADPGDYGDRIMVAMNVEITETAEHTDRAAAVRDAGVKVLCYIESDKYGNDLATLEEVVETFTYFPLNEICGGFFFGGFNIMLAIEDAAGMQSLYLKTQVRPIFEMRTITRTSSINTQVLHVLCLYWVPFSTLRYVSGECVRGRFKLFGFFLGHSSYTLFCASLRPCMRYDTYVD